MRSGEQRRLERADWEHFGTVGKSYPVSPADVLRLRACGLSSCGWIWIVGRVIPGGMGFAHYDSRRVVFAR